MHKIPSLFLAGSKGQEVDPEQAWVLDGAATATVMYDGLCYAVIKGLPYVHTVSADLNPDFIVCGTHSGQWWGWMPVPADDVLFWQVWTEEYDSFNFDWSYELCGPEVNGNPEHIARHVFKPHGTLIIECLQYPTPKTIRTYIESREIEGLVWWEDVNDPQCRKVKVQHTDFNRPRRAK